MLPVRMAEHHMACALVIPKDAVAVSQAFQILDPPIPRIPAHLRQGFIGLNHVLMILLFSIVVKGEEFPFGEIVND